MLAHLQVVVPLAPPRGMLRTRRLQRVHERTLHGIMPPPLLVAAGQHAAQLARRHCLRLAICVAVGSAVRGCVLAVWQAGAPRPSEAPAGWTGIVGHVAQTQGGQRLRSVMG